MQCPRDHGSVNPGRGGESRPTTPLRIGRLRRHRSRSSSSSRASVSRPRSGKRAPPDRRPGPRERWAAASSGVYRRAICRSASTTSPGGVALRSGARWSPYLNRPGAARMPHASASCVTVASVRRSSASSGWAMTFLVPDRRGRRPGVLPRPTQRREAVRRVRVARDRPRRRGRPDRASAARISRPAYPPAGPLASAIPSDVPRALNPPVRVSAARWAISSSVPSNRFLIAALRPEVGVQAVPLGRRRERRHRLFRCTGNRVPCSRESCVWSVAEHRRGASGGQKHGWIMRRKRATPRLTPRRVHAARRAQTRDPGGQRSRAGGRSW